MIAIGDSPRFGVREDVELREQHSWQFTLSPDFCDIGDGDSRPLPLRSVLLLPSLEFRRIFAIFAMNEVLKEVDGVAEPELGAR